MREGRKDERRDSNNLVRREHNAADIQTKALHRRVRDQCENLLMEGI